MNIISSRKISLSKAELAKAKKSVLITMPDDIEGTNCGNCKFFEKEGFCNNEAMMLRVHAKQCCNYWDRKGTIFIG